MNHSRRERCSGFTLVETVLSVAILGMIAAPVALTVGKSALDWRRAMDQSSRLQGARMAAARISAEARASDAAPLLLSDAGGLVLELHGAIDGSPRTVRYRYDAGQGTLLRSERLDPIEVGGGDGEVHGPSKGKGSDATVRAEFDEDEVRCYSTKDLSNVVLKFIDGEIQRFDGLSGHEGTFSGSGANLGQEIVGVWIKSGSNFSGDGPGYGEWVGREEDEEAGGVALDFGEELLLAEGLSAFTAIHEPLDNLLVLDLSAGRLRIVSGAAPRNLR